MNINYNSLSQPQYQMFSTAKFGFDIAVEKFLENMVSGENIRIVDAGCSHGKNSNGILNYILPKMLPVVGEKNIEVYHSDLERNSWTTTFNEFNHSDARYSQLSDKIYTYGIGKTIFGPMLPSDSVNFCIMMNILHWSSCLMKYKSSESIFAVGLNEKPYENEQYEELFSDLSNRAKELKKGGILIGNIFLDENPKFSEAGQLMKSVLNKMMNDGYESIEADEIDFLVPYYGFKVEKVRDLIETRLKEVKIINFQPYESPCAFQNFSKETKPTALMGALTGICEPFIMASLKGSNERKKSIFNELSKRMIQIISLNPTAYSSLMYNNILILEKL